MNNSATSARMHHNLIACRILAQFMLTCLGAGLGMSQHRPVRGRFEFPQPGVPSPAGLDPGEARLRAIKQMEEMIALQSSGPFASAAAANTWTPIGPQPTTSGTQHFGAWTSSMVVHPADPNTVYIGNPGSGVWKTTNGGAAWNPISDYEASLAIGSIALAPSDPNIIFAGTGNWNYGVGILKSTDAGQTWSLLRGPFAGPFGSTSASGGASVLSLAVHPQDPRVVLAGVYRVQAGVFRSTDGGDTWSPVLSGGQSSSVLFDPINPAFAYTAIEGYSLGKTGFYKSRDGGLTWQPINNGLNPAMLDQAGAIYLTLCAKSPQVLYASILGLNNTLAVVKSVDGGANWATLSAPRAPRAFHIIPHPQNPDVVFGGDGALYRSLDGGQTWNHTGLVNEFRSLAFSSDGNMLYTGGDFGIHKTTEPLAFAPKWEALNDTLNTVLFYSPLAIHPTNVNVTFGGAQDLGIVRYSGRLAWEQVLGCDGGTSIIDPKNPQLVYATCHDSRIFKSTRGGDPGSWLEADTGIDRRDRAAFIIPLAMDPSNPQRLLTGTYRIYQTLDGGSNWSPVSPDVTKGFCPGFQSLAVAPSDPNVVYSSTICGSVFVSTNAGLATPTWVDRSPAVLREVMRVVVDPANAMTAYAVVHGFTFGNDKLGHVLRTANGGLTWTDISGNLPNIPAYDLALDPDVAGTFYLATDIGVFATPDSGTTWTPLANGLPRASIRSVVLHRPSRVLRVAAFGRGMWDLLLPLAAFNPAPKAALLSPADAVAGGAALTLQVLGSGFVPGSVVRWNGGNRPTTFVGPTELQASILAADLADGGNVPITVFSPWPGGGASGPVTFTVNNPVPAANSLAPAETGARGPDLVLTVAGSNFVPSSVARWNGNSRPTRFVSGSQLTASITAADLVAAGLAQVTVANPPPGGGTSAALPFAVGPRFTAGSITNGASFASGVTPGAIVTIFGAGLTKDVTGVVLADTLPLPVELKGTSVTINGLAAPLFAVANVNGQEQINLQAPWELTGQSTATVAVTNNGLTISARVNVLAALPGIFTLDGGAAAILHGADNQFVTASSPAARGEAVVIYATGLGMVNPAPPTGAPALESPLSRTSIPPAVTVGGVNAEVLFSGLTPGLVGLTQVNFRVPENSPAGDRVPVVITSAGISSKPATLAVAGPQ